jgi:CelD/BcsL family acetyltransferase involved in cellulose biosynthesis
MMPETHLHDLEVKVINEPVSFRRISEDWNQLVTSSPSESLFLRHEWFDAAWEWLKQDFLMRILCVYRNEKVIGILPLVMRRKRVHGLRLNVYESFGVPDTQLFDLIGPS